MWPFNWLKRKADQTCLSCQFFDHCDPEDTEGVDGYCMHMAMTLERKDWPNEYGGHWTSSWSWCPDYKAKEVRPAEET